MAIWSQVLMHSVVEYHQEYYSPKDTSCTLGKLCIFNLVLENSIPGPTYVLYQLGDFYQNHRKYIQSKSNNQLAGASIQLKDAASCDPFITNKEMGKNVSYTGTPLDPKAVASPCGAIAYTFFNDTFTLSGPSGSIPIIQTGISWPGDQGGKYKRSANSSAIQWQDPEDEHFIVWMRTAGLPNFIKLWGKIENGMPASQYTLYVQNNYNSKSWQGHRAVIFTNTTTLGGRNYLIPGLFFTLSFSCLVAIFLLFRKMQQYSRYQE